MPIKVGNTNTGQISWQIREIGDSNTIGIDNWRRMSDVITLNNLNTANSINSNYSNLTINYDNKYIVGLINSNYIINPFINSDGLFEENEYIISLNNSNIKIKNSNIDFDFFKQVNFFNNNKDSILSFNNSSIDYNSDINYHLNNNSINYLNDSLDKIISINNNEINIDSKLITKKIYVDVISPINPTTGITIENFNVEGTKLNDVNIGNFTSNIYNTENIPPLEISINKDNIFFNNSIFQLTKYNYHNTNLDYDFNDSNILFKISNKGFINIGNCLDNKEDSFININNSYDYNTSNIIKFEGQYIDDSLFINKYGNLIIGSDINIPNSKLYLNRNDNRLNLDEDNNENINLDNPLLKININFKYENNYIWELKEIKTESFYRIFNYPFFDNDFAPSWRAKNQQENLNDIEKQSIDQNKELYLKYKYNYTELFENSENDNKLYNIDNENSQRDFFIIDRESVKLIYSDISKIKLNKDNDTGNNEIYNFHYNNLNLTNNDRQISFDYKIFQFTNKDILQRIFYPDKLYTNLNGISEEIPINITDITTEILIKKNIQFSGSTSGINTSHTQLYLEPKYEEDNNISRDDTTNHRNNQQILVDYLAQNNIFEFQPSDVINDVYSQNNSYFEKFTNITYFDKSIEAYFFTIHISRDFYNLLKNYNVGQKYSSFQPIDIYPNKPTFFEFTSNNMFISSFTDNGTLIFNEEDTNSQNDNYINPIDTTIPYDIKDFSIYSKKKDAIFNNIYINTLKSQNSQNIDFDKNNIFNINNISFSSKSNIIINDIQLNNICSSNNQNNEISYINNNINFKLPIYGLIWNITTDISTLPDYKNELKEDTFIDDYKNLLDLINSKINNIKNNKIYISYSELSEKNLIDKINYYDYINIEGIGFFYQDKFECNKKKYGEKYKINEISQYPNNYYNDIISIDSIKDSDIQPSISIYGYNPSYLLYSSNELNNGVAYYSTIKYSGFNKLGSSSDGINEKKNIYEISYNNNDNDIIFEQYNSYHILQHIGNEYDIVSMGKNYNFCIDNNGINRLTGRKWENIGIETTLSEELLLHDTVIENIISKKNLFQHTIGEIITFTPEDFDTQELFEEYIDENLKNKKFILNNYIKINGIDFYYKIVQDTFNYSVKNSKNSDFTISIGVPHKLEDINPSGIDYLYNYPRYFHEELKDSDYMLNIYGNTKISGIDGESIALSVKINDDKSLIDNKYKTNVSIGSGNNIINNDTNTLNVEGDIYSHNLYYKHLNIFSNVSDKFISTIEDIKNNIIPEVLHNTYIHTSNLNNNFNRDDTLKDNNTFDIDLIPQIPYDKFKVPINEHLYSHISYLEFDWSENKWSLNSNIVNRLIDLDDKIYSTQQTLDDEIDSTRQYCVSLDVELTSNLINKFDENRTDIDDTIQNLIDLDNDLTLKYHNTDNSLSNSQSSFIKFGEIEIDRIPIIPIKKIENLSEETLYSPKIDDNILEFTEYYYTFKGNNEDESSIIEYIVLPYVNENNQSYSVYEIDFFYDECQIDVLIVGGGGAGGSGNTGGGAGGGGGGVVEIKNINIKRGQKETIYVGRGGIEGDSYNADGTYSSAFDYIAYGGKRPTVNQSTKTILGGSGGGTNADESDTYNNAFQIKRQHSNDGEGALRVESTQPENKADGGKYTNINSIIDDDDDNIFNDNQLYIDGKSGKGTNEFFPYLYTYWGGGGGAARRHNKDENGDIIENSVYSKNGKISTGGKGGGAPGAGNKNNDDVIRVSKSGIAWKKTENNKFDNEFSETYDLEEWDSDIITADDDYIGNSIGKKGIEGSGGGGGGGYNSGGNGGSGIVIIKINNDSYPNGISTKKIPKIGKRQKGYLSFNYNSSNWQMNPLDAVNLDFNFDTIYSNLVNISNNLANEMNSRLYGGGLGIDSETTTINPCILTNGSFKNYTIEPIHIFGFNSKGFDIDENGNYISGDLVDLPNVAYTDDTNVYYPYLLKGSKLINNCLTNTNFLDNTITSDKIDFPINASKLALSIITDTDIEGIITNPVQIISSEGSKIDFNKFNNAFIEISSLNIDSYNKFEGTVSITNEENSDVKFNLETLSNILIDITSIDTQTNTALNSSTHIISKDNSKIPLDNFTNVFIDYNLIQDYDTVGFKFDNVYLYNEDSSYKIPQDYFNNIYINIDNIDENTLKYTNAYLNTIDGSSISPNLIGILEIRPDQINTSDPDAFFKRASVVTTSENKIDPSILPNVVLSPDDLNFDIGSLNDVTIISDGTNKIVPVNINNSYIDYSYIDFTTNKLNDVIIESTVNSINPNYLQNIKVYANGINFDFVSGLEWYEILTEPGNTDNKFDNSILNGLLNDGSLSFTQAQWDSTGKIDLNKDNYIITTNSKIYKPKRYSIPTTIITDDENKIHLSDIESITITPEQINNLDVVGARIILNTTDSTTLINPIHLDGSTLIINSDQLLSGQDSEGNLYKFPDTLTYDFADNSINPLLLPDNIVITIDMIDKSSGNKINNVNISGDIPIELLGNNLTINGNIIDSSFGNKIHNVVINNTIDVKYIHNATIDNIVPLKGEGTIGGNTHIIGSINAEYINDSFINLNDGFSKIIADSGEKFNGETRLVGEINANLINDVSINLDASTQFLTNTSLTGNVTITGIVPASFIDTPVSIKVIGALFDASELIEDNTITSDKFVDDINITVNKIIFSDSSVLNTANILSANSAGIGSINIVNANITSDSDISFVDNNLITTGTITTGILNTTSADIGSINIENANITSDLDISFVDNNLITTGTITTDILNANSITGIGSIKFSDLSEINTAPKILMDKKLIMNNTTNNPSFGNIHYDQSDGETGDGFIHCNGIHAEFNITAYSLITASDLRLKTDIKQLDINIENILRLNPVSFKWKDTNKNDKDNYGFIAQELEEIYPELISYNIDNYKAVNYLGLIPHLVKHIQNLEKRLNYIEKKYK